MNARHRKALEARADAWAEVQRLQTISHTRQLTETERSYYDAALDIVEAQSIVAEEEEARSRAATAQNAVLPDERSTNPIIEDDLGDSTRRVDRLMDGRPLTREDSFSAWTRDRGIVEGRDHGAARDKLDLGRYLRGLTTGQWDDAAGERRAMAEGTGSTGGYTVPTLLAAQLIDLARARTRVLEAGALLVPMASRVVDVAKWAADPAPAWRGESQVVSESDGAVGKVRLAARSLAVITRVSRELLEDSPNVGDALTNAFVASFAASIDYAALLGDGTPVALDGYPGALEDGPVGVANTAGVGTVSLGTDGAAADYDDLIDATGRLADNNERATAAIMAPRTLRGLRKLKDTTGQYLTPPAALSDVAMLDTTQVPVDQTEGTAVNASPVFVGDWSKLYVGVRTDLRIIPLSERYADKGEIGFLAWFRGDVAVARPGAFEVVTGAL